MKWIRKDLQGFVTYTAQSEECKIKLDANESPFMLPQNIKKELVKWIENNENFNIYPESDSIELKKELAQFYGIEENNFICGVGSDQIIDYIAKIFLDPGDVVVMQKPTFSMYAITAIINHGKIEEVILDDGFQNNIDKIINTVNKNNAKLLFLCTPNNPTGHSFTEDELISILESVDCPVIVDEAYAEFSGQTMIPYINKYKNLIVLRTFSKAYGIAGARVGYGIACREMINAISVVKAPYNLSTISQLLAILVLRENVEYKARIATLVENRDELYKNLVSLNYLKVYKSDANFILIESDKKIFDELKNNGILVRRFGGGDKETIRISVGDKAQNVEVFEVIKKALYI